MTLQQLKYALAIADCGSFNEASRRMFVTQPTLSNAIQDLESKLGFSLFIRSSKGVLVSPEGVEFLSYARQVLEQEALLEQRFLDQSPIKQRFCVSTQHYAFAVNAFVNLLKRFGSESYECYLRETKTFDIIQDVCHLRSEIGILYVNDFNFRILSKLFKKNELKFTELFCATPHVFISRENPLARKKKISLQDLEEYPCLSFEQGNHESFFFSEEILSTLKHKKEIRVSDRATLFNLLIGLNGYTISTGIISSDLNGENIIAKPLQSEENIRVGSLCHRNIQLSMLAREYLTELQKVVAKC